MRYVGSSFGDNANTMAVPATLADAALRFRKRRLAGAINVTNLFDKTYFSTCYPGAGCFYGEGRNIKGTLSVKF